MTPDEPDCTLHPPPAARFELASPTPESASVPASVLSQLIGLMLRAQLRGTKCYVAWRAAPTGPLFLPRSETTSHDASKPICHFCPWLEAFGGLRLGRAKVESDPSANSSTKVTSSYNRTWPELMRRGLDIDVLECPASGGRMRFMAAIMLVSAIRRTLRHLGLPSDPVELAPARAPPQLDDAWAC